MGFKNLAWTPLCPCACASAAVDGTIVIHRWTEKVGETKIIPKSHLQKQHLSVRATELEQTP